MPYTLYDGSIVQAKGAVASLIHLVELAEKQPNADAILTASLHPTMKGFTFQIFVVLWLSEMMLAKLTGREAASVENNITTYAEAKERLGALHKALSEADKDVVNKNGDVVGPVKMGPQDLGEHTAAYHATSVLLPNVYFHLTTAYGIMRKEGVPLEKPDYLKNFVTAPLA
ncbi:hypothetical protein N7507_001771 [Penicillium longicatenatum]|jgi:hypothetical protein|nr:hypothetical protein N7507_001771 [Penicillium longicatenatum]